MTEDQINNTADFDPFDSLTFETQPDELPPYLGIIMQDTRHSGVYRDQVQHQWVYAVRPVDLKAKAFYGYIKFSTSRNSVCMRTKEAFVRVLGKKNPDTGQAYTVGKGELVGKVMWFQQKSFDFGPNMSPSKPVPVPVRMATEEEIERAMAMPEYVPAASPDDGGSAPAAEAWAPSESELAEILAIYDGREHKEVLKSILKGAEEISDTIRAEVQSGRALNYLIEHGLVEKDKDGIIRVLETANA